MKVGDKVRSNPLDPLMEGDTVEGEVVLIGPATEEEVSKFPVAVETYLDTDQFLLKAGHGSCYYLGVEGVTIL